MYSEISKIMFLMASSFKGIPFTVVSISIVVLLSMPIIDEISNPPLITKLNLYLELDNLYKNLSKKNICKTSCELKLLLFAMFFTLPFKLSELIIL